MRMKRFTFLQLIVAIALAGLLTVSLVGCGAVQVKIGEQGRETIAEEAGFELGLYLGKDWKTIPTLYDFAEAMDAAVPGTAPDIVGMLRRYISKQCADDPIGQARLERLLRLVEIDIPTPAQKDDILAEAVRNLKAAGRGLKQAMDIMTLSPVGTDYEGMLQKPQ
jgi:hypothetical protein